MPPEERGIQDGFGACFLAFAEGAVPAVALESVPPPSVVPVSPAVPVASRPPVSVAMEPVVLGSVCDPSEELESLEPVSENVTPTETVEQTPPPPQPMRMTTANTKIRSRLLALISLRRPRNYRSRRRHSPRVPNRLTRVLKQSCMSA